HGRMMPGVDEIRSHLEGLHPAAPPFQSRQQRQRHRGLTDAAMSARNDESRKVHPACSPLIGKLHTGKDRSGGRAKKEHFLVVLIEEVINTTKNLPLFGHIIRRGRIHHTKGAHSLSWRIGGVVIPRTDEAIVHIHAQGFNGVKAEASARLIEWPASQPPSCVKISS